jgi:hypothetical protein
LRQQLHERASPLEAHFGFVEVVAHVQNVSQHFERRRQMPQGDEDFGHLQVDVGLEQLALDEGPLLYVALQD